MQRKKITVTGIALNAKAGAIVESDSDKWGYYVDDLLEWDKKFYGKKVKVTGTLIIEDTRKDSAKWIPSQEIIGIKKIIKHAKWTLIQ